MVSKITLKQPGYNFCVYCLSFGCALVCLCVYSINQNSPVAYKSMCNIKYITSCSWNPSLFGKFVVLAYRFHFIHSLLCQSHYNFVSFTRCSTEFSITRSFFIVRKKRIFTLVGFVIFYMLQSLLLVLLYSLLLMRFSFTSWICALVTFNILCVLYLILANFFFRLIRRAY